MNYVPFEFMDCVAATLRHLSSSKEISWTDDDFSEWQDAFNNARGSRRTYTMRIVKIFRRNELGICFYPDNVMLRRLNVEEFLELDRNSTQIHKITIGATTSYLTPYNTNVQSVGEYREIVEEIKPLTNWVTLEISRYDQDFMRGYIDVLSEIGFFEIGSLNFEQTLKSLSESFLKKTTRKQYVDEMLFMA